ncbi:MAG: hypothetical protein ACLFVO_25640 [Chloroflexaceae bacterium]
MTRLCAADLLAFLGSHDAEVLGVETLELPSSRTSLDTVLRLRGADGHPYLHLVEWQGWHDPLILWRTLSYLAWIGQNRPERPILVTLIYLTPADDVGDTLVQAGVGQSGWQITIPCIRLWQQDATAAIASGKPGLIALSPLMQGATADLVEQATRLILDAVDQPVQAEMLTALGIFAEPLLETERFIRLVTRERLMASDLISYLIQDKVAEWEQKEAKLQEENAALHAQLQAAQQTTVQAGQHAIEGILIARFPDAPLAVMHDIRRITNPERLQALIGPLVTAATLDEARRLLADAAAANGA